MNTRNFRIQGSISCLTSGSPTPVQLSNIECQLLRQTPLGTVFLGKGFTNADGNFNIDLRIDSPADFIIEGKIHDVVIAIYYNGIQLNPIAPISSVIVNEGYNNVGDFEVELNNINNPKLPDRNIPVSVSQPVSNSTTFHLHYSADVHEPTPSDLVANFTIYEPDGSVQSQVTLNPNTEGYIQLSSGLQRIVVIKPGDKTVLNYFVSGPFDRRDEENYLEVSGIDPATNLYTLIWDIVVYDNSLQIKDGEGSFHRILPDITFSDSIKALHINRTGTVFGFNESTNQWESLGTLHFTRFEFPENLDVVSDGFYTPSSGSGTVTTGVLGTIGTPFEGFFGITKNREPYFTNVLLEVFNDNTGLPPIFIGEFVVIPGNTDVHDVLLPGAPPTLPDNSPSIDAIEAVSGITFSTAFSDFLNTKHLTTVNKIRLAGPITYINDFPASEVGEEELKTLQGHVDLFSINSNAVQNQHLISEGYGNLQRIGNTPKNEFLNDVVDSSLPLFEAARIHEVASQTQKLVGNLLSGLMVDLGMKTPAIPAVPGSNFITTSLANVVNSCGCDDCKSGISPFAYLMDLIKYGAGHLDYTVTPLYTHGATPPHITNFVNLISDKFQQPFGALNVNCNTLHDEFCRVRLVTEVLEKIVDIKISAGQLTPAQIAKLNSERNQFFTLVYRSILTEAGTSLEEVRDIVAIKPEADKIVAAQAWADKLGITLYDPTYPNFTVNRVYLTLVNGNPNQVLNAANLEAIFGFRNTKRNVLTNTPLSIVEQWRANYLRDTWKTEDYEFTNYSREDVVFNNDSTFKTNWLPIIDPDIMGWSDMTYVTSPYAKALWASRKQQSDTFLDYCILNNTNVRRTSADFNNRIVKVLDRDIVSHVIDGNIIQLQRPLGTWNNLNLLNLALNGTNTDVALKKPTPTAPQPNMVRPVGANPKMRYKRVLTVLAGYVDTSGGALNPVINFPSGNPVLVDQLAGGYARFESTAGSSPYQTSPPVTSLIISSIVFNSSTQVTLTLTGGNGADATFLSGTMNFVYEVEVPIFTDVIVYPDNFTDNLFTVTHNYNLLSPVPSGMTSPLVYTTWNPPGSWPPVITATTNWERLKQTYNALASGISVSELTAIINVNLRMSVAAFNQMMLLMLKCENYQNSMFTFERPTTSELYNLASIIWTSAKVPQRDTWVKEEIKGSSTPPAMLRLNSQFFWKSITEPVEGSWDPSLQTIPATVGAINSTHSAIIDPELLPEINLVVNPEAKPYRDLYDARQIILDGYFTTFKGFTTTVTFDPNAFTKMLNQINTGNPNTAFNIIPYASLDALIADLQSTDAFKQKEASDIAWTAFRLTSAQLLEVAPVKTLWELNDPTKLPTSAQIDKAIKILISAFKRQRLYPTTTSTGSGWIPEEITGSFPSGVPVLYFNVMKMRMAPGRGNVENRVAWQLTLSEWNRQPFIQSDIIPPEYIKNFVPSNWVYTTWNLRRIALINTYNAIAVYINSSVPTAGQLFTNLQGQLDLIVQRLSSTTPPSQFDYLPYFTDLKVKEEDKEDIRPFVAQLGMSMTEYRFLSKIYSVLENATPSGPSPLIESEYGDIIDILIHIRNINLPFSQVQEEYTQGIILDQDYFQIFRLPISNFPLNDLQPLNKWRAPYKSRKEWLDVLQTRIDKEKAAQEKWKDVLLAAEDVNMPYMRDSLIRALQLPCELFEDTRERLAKTYFIETKDNCCVKHTRVSFAIETLQGLFFALQNGVYDDFITNFKLIAPYFELEWKWLGSYATWRSAMFIYLYPENLLYPTLKRKQSPAFLRLSSTLKSSNRFSPEDACFEADQFVKYLVDIENIEIACSSSAQSYYNDPLSSECCNDNRIVKNETYYFGLGKSGKPYWCTKQSDELDGLDFWQPLPLDIKDIQLVGCFVLNKRDSGWAPIESSLYLFYSYLDNGKLKMGQINKSLFDPGSGWSAPSDCEDLPKLDDVEPAFVTACQHSMDWEMPQFIFSYGKVTSFEKITYVKNPWSFHPFRKPFDWWINPVTPVITVTTFSDVHKEFAFERKSNKFIDNNYRVFTNGAANVKPTSAIYHPLNFAPPPPPPSPSPSPNPIPSPSPSTSPSSSPSPSPSPAPNPLLQFTYGFGAVTLVFSNSAYFGYLGKEEAFPVEIANVSKIIGAFESRYGDNTVAIHYFNTSGAYIVKECTYQSAIQTWNPSFQPGTPYADLSTYFQNYGYIQVYTYQVLSGNKNVTKIYPFFQNRTVTRNYAVEDIFKRRFAVQIIANQYESDKHCILHPENVNDVRIESAECIKDMNARLISVKNKMQQNMNQPQGLSATWIKRPDVVKELLYETYYFVPMLLALDQQKRGQFISALQWYRSVYDYTIALIDKRKIFYGLKLEETIANVFYQAPNWLLDPLNPHLMAQTRTNAYTKYTLMNIVQCMNAYADRQFTLDTIETVPVARKWYTEALELLKTGGLLIKDNMCVVAANACLDAATATAKAWSTMYVQLKDELAGIGSSAVIESISPTIINLLNSATDETYPEKFAEAFELIETSTPPPEPTEDVITFLDSQEEKLNDAGRYVLAINEPKDFNAFVSNSYATAVAEISGISVSDLVTPDGEAKIEWLMDAVPDNTTDYTFGFTNAAGKQVFSGGLSFNPNNPGPVSYNVNLKYKNGPVVIGLQPIEMPVTFSPLITFSFCNPSNPVYKSLQMKGNLELFKIFNCRNIAGMVRELSPFAAATDSTTGIPIIGASGNLVLPGVNNFAPTQYRFNVLLERAKQIAQQAQQMESLFLASIEKEDAENYAVLRATQDLETSRATIKLQDLRINQAKDERVVASLQLDKVNFIQNHYNDLIADGLLDFEQKSLDLLIASTVVSTVGAAVGLAGFAVLNDPRSNLGNALNLVAGGLRDTAALLSSLSNINAQRASFKRREQEWKLQSQLAGFDISIANQQIKISDDNIRIVTQEREIAVLNTNHAQQTVDFLKNKFTNAELYNWMGSVLEGAYSYMLNLSTAIARTAEQQLYFERQEQAGPFILDDYWETPSSGFTSGTSDTKIDRRGLTGSARLLVDITKLEQHAFETNKRKLQMTKTISLAQNFPSEFQNFKETGVLNFELTNKLFDYDFPGHYLRLIKGVRTSVIGLIPVYDGVKATLTAGTISYTVIGGTTFQKVPIRRVEFESVALTSANNATGVFELQPVQSELLNPFESMGIESQWEFKMPQYSNHFDYRNIADVVLAVDYTAMDSFQYKTQVLLDNDNTLFFNRGFSFKNNFPDQWYELGEAQEGSLTFSVTIELKLELFPQGIQDLKLDGTNLSLLFARADGFEDEVENFDFLLAGGNVSLNKKTNKGILSVGVNTPNNSPVMNLTLVFDNNFINRELFSKGNVTDIVLIVGCKAELVKYPL